MNKINRKEEKRLKYRSGHLFVSQCALAILNERFQTVIASHETNEGAMKHFRKLSYDNCSGMHGKGRLTSQKRFFIF